MALDVKHARNTAKLATYRFDQAQCRLLARMGFSGGEFLRLNRSLLGGSCNFGGLDTRCLCVLKELSLS